MARHDSQLARGESAMRQFTERPLVAFLRGITQMTPELIAEKFFLLNQDLQNFLSYAASPRQRKQGVLFLHILGGKVPALGGQNMPLFGYARVSTRDQNLVAQDAELRAAGCGKVFKEKVSGAKTDRPELVKAIGRLEPGDVLVVTRLDRLARSTRDLLNIMAAIAERGAGFKSLKDAWADTTSAHGRLMLTVLGGLAEFERE